jgi:arabinose-5-phosphate isomerase
MTASETIRDDISAARRVLALEAEGIAALAETLDGRFATALDLLHGVAGRIIVTGMGKSGHVARKIAATLASTGSPAYYVHPAEASHGDLGMVTRGDALLALSNSGATAELADLIAYAARIAIPLIAITSREPSPLADAAAVALLLPQVPEACPLGLAPTTSTTMALALGDALAVALLERRGFSPHEFHELHPGGALGSKLTRVGDIMHVGAAMPTVSDGATMSETLIEMTGKSFGCVGVLDAAGRLAGIITDGDLRRHMSPSLLERCARDVMTRSPKTIAPKALAAEAVAVMNAATITSLFVLDPLDGGVPAGIVHLHDCLRAGIR